MKVVKNSAIITIFTIVFGGIASLVIYQSLDQAHEMIFLSAFILFIIATFSIRKASKELYLDKGKSVFKEKDDQEIIDKRISFYSFGLAGILNLGFYFILVYAFQM